MSDILAVMVLTQLQSQSTHAFAVLRLFTFNFGFRFAALYYAQLLSTSDTAETTKARFDN